MASTYRLSLRVDTSKLEFSGKVTVGLASPSREVHLHSLGLQIDGVSTPAGAASFHLEPEKQELVVGPLPNGTTELTVAYRGRVSTDSLAGFYRSRHGVDGQLLTTHLAPTAARRLLPCVDHPAAKAVFEVDVTTTATDEVVFNTSPRSVSEQGGQKTWKFEPTPKMSTYLLYLGIGRFDTVEETRGGIRVAVKAAPGSKGSCGWALENGQKSVHAFSEYYGIPYPLPKLDLISVRDFAAGAMENWGAISFRESALLADERTSTLRRRVIAEIVAHEIAHQWFGNLVTMEWWNDIWLNESFATHMSFKMVDRFYPDWDALGQFLFIETGPALLGDSMDSTHPIDVEVKNVDEIGGIFDEISYGKGASVLRMIEAFVSEEAFRRGVAGYLRAHAYGNARGEELWSSVEASSATPVRHTIDAWIHRPGHPLVKAERRGEQVHLSQRRFHLAGDHPAGEWPVPLICRAQGKVTRMLFEGPELDLPLPSCDDLTLNQDSVGFYRVLYDGPTYARLREHLLDLSSRERWGMLRDLFAFLHSGDVDLPTYLGFLRKVGEDEDWLAPLEASDQALLLFEIFGETHPIVRDLRELVHRQGERLGPEKRPGEPPSRGVLRERVNVARAFLEPDFARTLAPRFKDWTTLDPDLRTAVAVAFARTGGADAHAPMVALAGSVQSEAEVEQLLVGLTSFREGALVSRTLDWALEGGVSRGLVRAVGIAAAGNPASRAALWDWFQRAVERLEAIYQGTAMLSLMVEQVIPSAGLGREAEVRRVLSGRPIAECDRAVRKGLELLAIRERMLARSH